MSKLPLEKMSEGIYTLPKSGLPYTKIYISCYDEKLKGKLASIFNRIKLLNTGIRYEFFDDNKNEIQEEMEIRSQIDDCTHFVSILSNKFYEFHSQEDYEIINLMSFELSIALEWGGPIFCFVPEEKQKYHEELPAPWDKITDAIPYKDIRDLAAKILSEIYIEILMYRDTLSDKEQSELGLYKYLVNDFETLEPKMRNDLLSYLSTKESTAPGIAQILFIYFDSISIESKIKLLKNLLHFESASKLLPWVLADKNDQIPEELKKILIYKLIEDQD
jgi:hypothetical protein